MVISSIISHLQSIPLFLMQAGSAGKSSAALWRRQPGAAAKSCDVITQVHLHWPRWAATSGGVAWSGVSSPTRPGRWEDGSLWFTVHTVSDWQLLYGSGGWSDTPPIAFEHGGCVTNIAVKVDGKRPIGARARRIREPHILLCSYSQGRDRGLSLVCESLDDMKDYCQPQAPGGWLASQTAWEEFMHFL